jgi:hypothetical protein
MGRVKDLPFSQNSGQAGRCSEPCPSLGSAKIATFRSSAVSRPDHALLPSHLTDLHLTTTRGGSCHKTQILSAPWGPTDAWNLTHEKVHVVRRLGTATSSRELGQQVQESINVDFILSLTNDYIIKVGFDDAIDSSNMISGVADLDMKSMPGHEGASHGHPTDHVSTRSCMDVYCSIET